MREWRVANPTKAQAADRRYRESAKGKKHRASYKQSKAGKAAQKRYQQSPKGKAQAARFRQGPKRKAVLMRYYHGRGRETLRRYQQTPKGRASLARGVHKRRMILQGQSDLTADQWATIKARYQQRCVYCAKKTDLTMDHIIPLSKGGQHTMENILPACRSCNSRKGNRISLNALLATSGTGGS